MWAGALLAASAASAAGAETVVLEAVERGSFREDGSYVLGPEAAYSTGRGPEGEERAVFGFDVSALGGTATSAALRLWSPVDGFANTRRVERIAVYAVTTDPAALAWERTGDPAGASNEGERSTFWDLGSGARIGAARIKGGFEGFVEVPLDAALLRVLDRAEGLVALGVSADSLRKRGDERVFVDTGPGVPPPQLVVSIDPSAVPGPAAALHVDRRRGSARGDGSAARPFAKLAAALDLATPGDVVFVAPGRYAETLVLKHGVHVVGSGADRTILDLGWERPSLRCADAVLSDVFIWRDVAPFRPPPFASAVDCTNGASPIIARSRIAGPGAAVLLERSHATLQDNQIDGAILGVAASPALVENEIDWPTAISLSFPSTGAAPFRIERNRIRGALELDGAAPEGNEIVGNLFLPSRLLVVPLQPFGGGLQASAVGDLGLIASNTFFRTQGISLCDPPAPVPPFTFPLPHPVPLCAEREQGATAVIANNILAFGSLGILRDAASDPTIVHNDVFGNHNPFGLGPSGNYVGLLDMTGVDGNISQDPLFAGSGYETAALAAGSPALDAGANELAASELDLDGGPRIVDATGLGEPRIDIGATEHQPGEDPPRAVQVSVEARYRVGVFGLGDGLAPGRPFRVAVLSDAELDAPVEVDATSLAIEGAAPRGRCRARDVDDDGDDDLLCRFRFEALEGLPRFATKRVCVSGALLADGAPIRGCDRVNVLLLPRATVR